MDEALAAEIRTVIAKDDYDIFDIPVRNFIGKHYVKHGWGGGSFGALTFSGLFRKGVKWWAPSRVHPHISVTGRRGHALTNGVDHFVDRDISDMLRRLDRYTDFRARDMVDLGETDARLATMFRKFLSRFWKIYVVRKAYKEKELGFMVALCGALYPLIAHIKAVELAERGKQA